MGRDWKPIVVVPASGGPYWLGVGLDGDLVYGDVDDDNPTSLVDAPIAAFPLLESPWSEVEPKIADDVVRAGVAMPLDPVLILALKTGAYWPARAVDWIEAGYPIVGLMETLAAVGSDRRLPQNTRHRVRRLLNG